VEEVDLTQFVLQPIPHDPEQMRLSLIFSKDLISCLQNDIADLHHRLEINQSEFDEQQGNMPSDDENDITTITINDDDNEDNNNNEDTLELDEKMVIRLARMKAAAEAHLQEIEQKKIQEALDKKKSDHDRFFSVYNILSKQPQDTQQLISSLGTFEALVSHSQNCLTYENIIANLVAKLKNTRDQFQMIIEAFADLDLHANVTMDTMDMEKMAMDMNITEVGDIQEVKHAQSLSMDDVAEEFALQRKLLRAHGKQVLQCGQSMIDSVDEVMDEFTGARNLVHPDRKKYMNYRRKSLN
jgi:hypothetical protein